jgi:hypothetical protein
VEFEIFLKVGVAEVALRGSVQGAEAMEEVYLGLNVDDNVVASVVGHGGRVGDDRDRSRWPGGLT